MGGINNEKLYLCQPTPTYDNSEVLRIVMLGKTGVGKSASGNTILGKEIFKSELASQSLTKVCKKAVGEVNGEKVSVIDTPGLFDTDTDQETTMREIARCMIYAAPGPHVFLVVVQLGRYTQEEKNAVLKIQKMFGEEADRHSMVLFTHGDRLKGKPVEEFLKDSKALMELVEKCNGNYHVFNNEATDQSQVGELLDKIRRIKRKDGGSHYTSKMFRMAEKAIEEEEIRIKKEKQEQMRKEEEELMKKIQEKFEQPMKEVKDDMEMNNKLMESRDRETKEEIEKIRKEHDILVRREAENSASTLEIIIKMIIDAMLKIFFK